MKKRTILGMPLYGFIIVVGLCFIGIIVGSICDFQINSAIYNKTDFGAFFATYGSYFSYCLYPAAGMCIFKGLKKKNQSFLAWTLLIVSYFLAVYYSNSYNGAKVRELFHYDVENPNIFISLAAYLFWVVLYAWVPVVFYFILDDSDPKTLISVGIIILLAGVVSDCVNLWLKQVASRPRFKYLITLENPRDLFRNWWEMKPYLAGSNDNFKSWPSGNMTIATMMMTLPLLLNNLKWKKSWLPVVGYCVGLAFVILYGYNRMHMGNHFLSDVSFGVLITYLIHSIIDFAFFFEKQKSIN